MSIRWIEKEWQEFRALRFRQHGNEDETPAAILARKQLHRRRFLPIFSDADPEQCTLEVGDLWLHMPTAWNTCINIDECPTSAMLIKLAMDREEQLLASLVTTSNSVVKLVWQEMQKLSVQNAGSCQLFPSHMAEVEEDKEPMEDQACQSNPRALQTRIYTRPWANTHTLLRLIVQRIPPCDPAETAEATCTMIEIVIPGVKETKRIAENCLSTLLIQLTKKHTYPCCKETTKPAASTVICIMPQWTLSTVEALLVQTTITLEDGKDMLNGTTEGIWNSLEANVAELESANTPFEDVYQPEPIWQRPMGHVAKGIDAFKILCHVNCLKEAAAIVIGDSGAALTLISENFLKGLKWSKPKPRTGRKLELIQLTGS